MQATFLQLTIFLIFSLNYKHVPPYIGTTNNHNVYYQFGPDIYTLCYAQYKGFYLNSTSPDYASCNSFINNYYTTKNENELTIETNDRIFIFSGIYEIKYYKYLTIKDQFGNVYCSGEIKKINEIQYDCLY